MSKVYDGTTAATLAAGNYTLSGVIGGDSVALNNPTSGTYGSPNVGSGITVGVNGSGAERGGGGQLRAGEHDSLRRRSARSRRRR